GPITDGSTSVSTVHSGGGSAEDGESAATRAVRAARLLPDRQIATAAEWLCRHARGDVAGVEAAWRWCESRAADYRLGRSADRTRNGHLCGKSGAARASPQRIGGRQGAAAAASDCADDSSLQGLGGRGRVSRAAGRSACAPQANARAQPEEKGHAGE